MAADDTKTGSMILNDKKDESTDWDLKTQKPRKTDRFTELLFTKKIFRCILYANKMGGKRTRCFKSNIIIPLLLVMVPRYNLLSYVEMN